MLVVSRKEGERVMVGNNIVVTLVAVRGDNIRLGFDAPGLPVLREELVERARAGQVPANDFLEDYVDGS